MAGPRIPGAGFFDIDGVAMPHSTPPQLVFHTIHGSCIFTYTYHKKSTKCRYINILYMDVWVLNATGVTVTIRG